MAVGVSFTTEDAKGAKSTTIIYIPDATTLTDAQEFAAAMGQALADIMTGGVVAIGICYDVSVASLTSNTIEVNSDVEEGARFGWEVAGGFNASNRLATFAQSKLIAGSKEVDLTDADVIVFVDYMIDGFTPISTLDVLPIDYRNADIIALTTSLENFTKSRILRT